jgi:hypothetical protein
VHIFAAMVALNFASVVDPFKRLDHLLNAA